MGHDLYFTCPTGTAKTSTIHVSYSFNAFYHFFNPTTTAKNTTGADLAPVLTDAINRLNRRAMTLETSKDPLKPVPGTYAQIMNFLLSYAKVHPTWIFHCD
jgi:hypothetical protein